MSFLRALSLQSRLLAAIVFLTLASIAVVAWIGYTTTRDALTASVERELLGLQRTKTTAVRNQLTMTRNQVLRLSGASETGAIATELLGAYRRLEQEPISDAMRDTVRRFYTDEFEPALKKAMDLPPERDTLLPGSNPGWYVQYHYIAQGLKPYDGRRELVAAGDASAYGAVVRRIHPRLTETVQRLGFDNVLLVDQERLDVFFSYNASSVLGTNLVDGPYAASNLAAIARSLRSSKDEDDYRLADFEFYRPALGAPYAFVASPVFDGPRYVAILVVRMPLGPIADVISGGRRWREEGLGDTGETYLLGPDQTMRTESRFLIEDRARFIAGLRRSSLTTRTVDEVERLGTTTLTVPVRHAAARAALNGQSGLMRVEDYRGVPVFMAYGPLDLDSLRWGVISKVDVEEALRPLRDYARRTLLAAAALSLLASLAAVWLASMLTRPVEHLVEGARRIGAGELAEVPVARSSEFRVLGEAFNDMVRSLRSNRAELDHQVQETERLLVSLLPASGAAHVREGRHEERQTFTDVTVAYVSLHGLDGAEGSADDAQSMELMSELVAAFDEAAEQADVEKVRTIGSSYLAASGLSVQRPDHTARMVAFALEVVRIVRRFNAERDRAIVAEIGINAGPVTGGLVGRRRFIYDLWGDTVKIARSITFDGRTSIHVTRAVHDRVRDHVAFGPPIRSEMPGIGPVDLYPVGGDASA
jgi:class 3 adenylate cyclase